MESISGNDIQSKENDTTPSPKISGQKRTCSKLSPGGTPSDRINPVESATAVEPTPAASTSPLTSPQRSLEPKTKKRRKDILPSQPETTDLQDTPQLNLPALSSNSNSDNANVDDLVSVNESDL